MTAPINVHRNMCMCVVCVLYVHAHMHEEVEEAADQEVTLQEGRIK